MSSFIEIDHQQIPVDDEGYLKDLQDWSEAVAFELARREDISLGPAHGEVLNLLRTFYERHQVSLATRALINLVKRELGRDKGSSNYQKKLCHGNPAKTDNKIAGLPKPENCI